MQELIKLLEERLGNTERLAILGAGSLLSGDDAAGVLIASRLREKFERDKLPGLLICEGHTAPENFSGEIKRFKPDHLIVVDAADLKEEPGSALIIEPEIIDGVSFSTHMLPLKVMTEYIKNETGCAITFMGIQNEDVSYGSHMTPKVSLAVDEISDIMEKVIIKLLKR